MLILLYELLELTDTETTRESFPPYGLVRVLPMAEILECGFVAQTASDDSSWELLLRQAFRYAWLSTKKKVQNNFMATSGSQFLPNRI